jgi:hypothetical protein
MSLALVVEGDTDLPVARKLAADANLDVFTEMDAGGKHNLDAELDSYNGAAKGAPWFVLRDLDEDAPCAGSFLERIAFRPSTWMCLRLAVHELESWLLADHEGVAAFFKVTARDLPQNPDEEVDPTERLVNLCRKSRSRRVREGMVPRRGSTTTVGPLYEALIIEFGTEDWSLSRARHRSPSLRRAQQAIRGLGVRWNAHARGAGKSARRG